jgi:uncharacterized iron-regulated membrane protein
MSGRIFITGPSTNPLMQVVYLLLGGLVLIGALLMGAVILAFVLGFALIFGIVIWVRVWWLRRKMLRARDAQAPPGSQSTHSESGRVIEVEYTVVDERNPGDDRRE